jgi:hypothetical protein
VVSGRTTVQLTFQIRWYFFLNRAVSGRCCPSVQTVTFLLHAIFIIRIERPYSVDWHLDGCKSSACLALLRIVYGRCRPDVRTIAAVFPYLCLWRKSFYLLNTDWRLGGIATLSGRMHLKAKFFWDSKEHPDMLPWHPDVCKLEQFEASWH